MTELGNGVHLILYEFRKEERKRWPPSKNSSSSIDNRIQTRGFPGDAAAMKQIHRKVYVGGGVGGGHGQGGSEVKAGVGLLTHD